MSNGKMTVKISCNGETVETTCEQGATIQALFDGGHLRGLQTGAAAVRVNGKLADRNTQLNDGDRVNAVPTGGRLAS